MPQEIVLLGQLAAMLNWIEIDRETDTPLYEQIGVQIRDAISIGRLPPATTFPASRVLSRDLGVSRSTT